MKISILFLLFSIGFQQSSASGGTFEKRMQLELTGDSSGYTFAMPNTVYENAYYSDLKDVRIINATGDFVPMRTFLVSDEVKNQYSQTSLPTFKLNKTINKTITQSLNSRQVRTTRAGTDEDYTVVTSKSLRHYLESLEVKSPNQIIIDASVLTGKIIENLEIQWQYESQGNRIFYIDLDASNDLSHWNNIKNRQQLIEINTNHKTLLENKILLNSKTYNFYRITFLDNIIPEVTNVKAQLLNKTIKMSQNNKDIVNYSLLHDNILLINTDGYYPVESFTLSFNQKNTITDVKLFSRSNNNKKWQFAGAGTIYSMTSDGVTVKQDSIKTRRSNHRFWKIQLDKHIKNTSVNKIEMSWRNHQIEFLAQGQAPFTLVYANSGKITPASRSWYNKIPTELTKTMFSNQVLLKKPDKSDLELNKARTIENIVSNDNSKWIFWSILAIVLLVLFFMAYRLVAESGDDNNG